jgi:hypothetical protein
LQSNRFLAKSLIWRGLTLLHLSPSAFHEARQCYDEASGLLDDHTQDHVRKDLIRLKHELTMAAAGAGSLTANGSGEEEYAMVGTTVVNEQSEVYKAGWVHGLYDAANDDGAYYGGLHGCSMACRTMKRFANRPLRNIHARIEPAEGCETGNRTRSNPFARHHQTDQSRKGGA